MKTNPEALKKLYVAMGGNEEDVADISLTPDMIEALADVYEGGGGASLPEVTSEDNGDVLTVVNGEWDKAEAAKELPTVKSTDNKKILAVVDGEWSKAAKSIVYPDATAADAGKVFTVDSNGLWGKSSSPVTARVEYIDYTAEIDPETTQITWSCNWTATQIISARNTGAVVIARVELPMDGGTAYLPLAGYKYVNDRNALLFSTAGIKDDGEQVSVMSLYHVGGSGAFQQINVSTVEGYLSITPPNA